MSTSMNKTRQQEISTVGLLLIVGDIISNEQRQEICIDLKKALKQIDHNKYHEINDLFNNLIHPNEFQADSQYRQMANTENGSFAGFLYLPNFHTLLNVLKDLFNTCYHVCLIFCGQQIDSNGSFILSDSLFTFENLYSLFEENPSYLIQDLQIVLPFISNEWRKLSNDYLHKQLEHIQLNDLSDGEINQENSFGKLFYERFVQGLNKESSHFDIYTKLIARDSSGTIAFDEPNLYILYGQQGEASLFGIRGFVVLINGGFSRIPSYWNLIRGLQTIDACILTHFDYDVFPGLQTLLHRLTIPSTHDGQLCKPNIGTIFLNHNHRTKIQSISSTKSTTNSKLSVNLPENIEQFLNNIKQLNINTFDLIKHTKTSIEPINLYKKIAFGSLDLYVLHPTASTADDEKNLAALQKIAIRNQQPSSSSIIPFHHWYSSCSLLVWTPTSKSNKDSLVRILYTGACPQTLVFEALTKVQHLEFLHEFEHQQQPQQQEVPSGNIKTKPSANTNANVKQAPQKPKVSPPVKPNRAAPPPAKVSSPPIISKPKVSQTTTTTTKTEKPQSAPTAKKTPPSTTGSSARSTSKDKKTQKSHGTASKDSAKPKQVKTPTQKLKTPKDQTLKLEAQNGHDEEKEGPHDHEQKLEAQIEHDDTSDAQNDHEEKLEVHSDHEQTTETQNRHNEESDVDHEEVHDNDEQKSETQSNHQEELITENKQNPQTEIDHEQKVEVKNHDEEQSTETHQSSSIPTNNEEKPNETSKDNHEDEIKRPESVLLTKNHDEPFIESNTASPMNELKFHPDPTTTCFVEGISHTENSYIENTENDDEMEIIHHDISTSNKDSIPSTEEINPQGLPIENNIHSKKPSTKKLSNESNRTNEPSTHKSKPSSDSIFHVDVAYIPYHGNEHYVDSEFFRRIRARYYILNAIQINRLTLESLIDGKQQWENKEHVPITLVPTFDGDQLRQFFLMNKNRLAELNINILPAAIRCNVQYDDEGSPAQRLRFSPDEQ